MLDLIFIIFNIITALGLISIFKLSGIELNRISIVNITFFSMYLFSIVGTLPMYFQLDEYRYNIGVDNPELVFAVNFYSTVNIVLFLFGVIFVRNLLGLVPTSFNSNEIKTLGTNSNYGLFILFLFVIGAFILYITKVDKIAVVTAMSEGVSESKVARSEMGNNLPGGYHWYSLILNNFGVLVSLAMYATWLTRRRFIDLFFFLASFGLVLFISVMATEKAPIIDFIIALIIVYICLTDNGLFKARHIKLIIGFAILVSLILTLFYSVFMGVAELSEAYLALLSRIFAGSIMPAYFYLQYFPSVHDYLYGTTFPNPGQLLDFEPFQYTIEVRNWVVPEQVNNGVVGTMPTVFWGEAYANFGPIGIPFVAFIVGSMIAFFDFLISKIEINALTLALFVWLIIHFKGLAVTGFSGYFFDFYLFFTVMSVFIILLLSGKITIRK